MHHDIRTSQNDSTTQQCTIYTSEIMGEEPQKKRKEKGERINIHKTGTHITTQKILCILLYNHEM